MIKFDEILSKFQIEGDIKEIVPLTGGNIHHTYMVHCGDDYYVLQEMNHIVYKYPTEIMNNLFLVTEYLRDVIEAEGKNPDLETLTFIRTKSGNQLLQTEDGSYFRLYRMIRGTEVMEKPATKETAYEAAKIVGIFHRRMRDFDVSKLGVSVPKMHDIRFYMRQLLDAVRADICFRSSDCQEQIQFILDRSKYLYKIEEAINGKAIKKRVTHNDTGYKNILVDSDSKKAICLIDLDTVMAGISILDFADAVRVGAATIDENDKSGTIELDLDLYTSYVQGYCYEMGRVLNDTEKALLGYSVWFVTMEYAIRYITDYLSGNTLSRDFSDDKANLYRAVNQLLLVCDIEDKISQIEEINNNIFNKL